MSEIAPPHSYISYNSDSNSPHDFAKHLENIAGNDTLYASYFWWRDYYEIRNSQAFVICVQDLMIQTNSQKSIMICTIGGSKMLAVRNMTIKFLYIIINISLMNGYKGLDILQCKLKRT
jgi:hypothetical protein